MVNKCSAYGCKSGYSNSATPSTVSFHSYPLLDSSLLEKWNKANPRKNFKPTKCSRLCSLHFFAEDFVEATQDSNIYRRKDGLLKKRYLKPDAVPSIFPNAPVNLSANPQRARSTRSARLENDSTFPHDQEAGDSIANCSLLEIQQLLDSAEGRRPAGFQTSICDGQLCVYMLEVRSICRVACSICIAPNCCVSIGLNGAEFPLDKVNLSLAGKGGKVSSICDILKVMARVKDLKEQLVESQSANS